MQRSSSSNFQKKLDGFSASKSTTILINGSYKIICEIHAWLVQPTLRHLGPKLFVLSLFGHSNRHNAALVWSQLVISPKKWFDQKLGHFHKNKVLIPAAKARAHPALITKGLPISRGQVGWLPMWAWKPWCAPIPQKITWKSGFPHTRCCWACRTHHAYTIQLSRNCHVPLFVLDV